MQLLQEIKERRLIPLTAAYLVTGFVALEAMDQLISYGFVAEVAYPVTLVLYLFGIPSSFIFAWYHGAPGRQHAGRGEVVLQVSLALVAVTTCVYVYRSQASAGLALDSGLPATSVAVLYFEDVSPRGDLGYVADGITEALIDQLDEVPSLHVISRNGVAPYREGELRADSIARILGVGTLIQGSVDQRGEELRISTRLVDGFSGADIDRAAPLEIPSGEFLAARDSVAGSVSRLLRRRLGEEVRLRELRSGTTSDEAWALTQRAERLATDAEDSFEAGGAMSASVELYEQADSLLALAADVDPDWTRPPAARARAAYRKAWFAFAAGNVERVQDEIEAGIGHADRALTLDGRDAFALEQRGTLHLLEVQLAMALGETDEALLDGMVEAARSDLAAAVNADPSLATAHAMLSFLLAGLPDNIGAILSGRRALEEDAYLRGAERIYDRLFLAQYQQGQFRDAQRTCEEGYARFPGDYRFTECRLWLLTTPQATPDVDAAWQLLEELDTMVPESIRRLRHEVGTIMVAGVLRRAGLPDSAATVLAQVDHGDDVDPQSILLLYEAGIRASTGDPDGGLDVLRRWVAATPGSALPPGEELHWWWQDLRGQAGFQQLVSADG